MSDIDPKKLKVTELRDELKQRGLETKGTKPVLVKRLSRAIATESGADPPNDSVLDDSALEVDTTTEDAADSSQEQAAEEKPSEEPQEQNVPEPEVKKDAEPEVEPEVKKDTEPEVEPEVKKDAEPEVEPEVKKDTESEVEPEVKNDAEPEIKTDAEPEVEPKIKTDAKPEVEPEIKTEPAAEQEPLMEESVKEDVKSEDAKSEDTEVKADKADEVSSEETKEEVKTEKDAPKEGGEAMEGQEEGEPEEGMPMDGEFQVMDSVGDTEVPGDDNDKRGEKRHRSRSRDRDRYNRYDQPYQPEPMESDAWLEETNMQLDRFNSDLNLRIKDDGVKANPITAEGFAFMWAGARSTFGTAKGKVGFEIKILEELNVNHLPPEETSKHVVRVGFSTDACSTQLGEEKLSYGYGGTGKASTDCKFQDFGTTFGEGDVLGAYVDFESDPIEISYTKNDTDLGKCFDVDKNDLGEQALFPHVLTKNCEFEVNYGDKEEPFFPIKEGYTWISKIEEEDRVRGTLPPAKKEECEMLMMCGLPGAGKTVWANKHATETPENRYNILGTNNIIDKMKVMGLPRKKNYSGRWDVLIEKSTRCLNRLFEISSRKKRNYILDQTNVYPSAQRRKMRPFEGFQRKAIVIVPTDEEYKNRCEKREKEEGKEVPDSAILEMKANFALPEEGTTFDKVEFIEQEKDEAAALVEKYNKEGRDALPPPDKRYRDSRFSGGGGARDYARDNKQPYRGRGGAGAGGYNSGGRGGYDNRRGGGYGGSRGYDNRRGGPDRRGGSYMGYSQSDRRRVEGGGERTERRDHKSSSYENKNSRYSNQSGSGWNKSGSGSWGGNQGSWGGNQGSWAGNQGSWGGNQGNWGNQNYQGAGNWAGNQWSGYQNQNQGSQGWGQNYNYNWGGQPGSWGNYNQNQGTSANTWSGYGSSYGSGGTSGSYQSHK